MIQNVTFEKTEYHEAPARFEAGTGNIADAVGLGAALDYVERIGIDNINRYEHELMAYATHGLSSVPGLRLIGTAADKAGVLSFSLKGFTTEEVGSGLNDAGIAVRAGHHCAQPILRRFGLETTVRPSLAMYNTFGDVDALVTTLHRMRGGRTFFNAGVICKDAINRRIRRIGRGFPGQAFTALSLSLAAPATFSSKIMNIR